MVLMVHWLNGLLVLLPRYLDRIFSAPKILIGKQCRLYLFCSEYSESQAVSPVSFLLISIRIPYGITP